MVCIPASTCTCLTFEMCENACGKTRSMPLDGTLIALTLLFNCPLCSAWAIHWRTIRLNRLFSRRVSQMGSAKIFRVSLCTKSSSHPKVLHSPMYGSFSRTAFSNSLSLSDSCSSIDSWISSPAKWSGSDAGLAIVLHSPASCLATKCLQTSRGCPVRLST